MSRPQEIVASVQDRLRRLNPAARFRGCTETEIAEAERNLAVRIPAVLREFILRIGWEPGGLWTGSEFAAAQELSEFRKDAEELLAESKATFVLPPSAIVFLLHQGYSFLYIEATEEPDGPVWQVVEGRTSPERIGGSIAQVIDVELALMEKNRER